MLDRQRLAIVLAVEISAQPANPARLAFVALGEKDLRPVAPKHQDVALLRAVEPPKVQQAGDEGCSMFPLVTGTLRKIHFDIEGEQAIE